MSEVLEKAKVARLAFYKLARTPNPIRNEAIRAMAEGILERMGEIIEANSKDVEEFSKRNPSSPLLDRLMLNEKRVRKAAEGLRRVAFLPDPIGEVVEGWRNKQGLKIRKVRVPIGVLGVVYEARPNVTMDITGLAVKSGNSCILKGGSEALNSNLKIVEVLRDSVKGLIPEGVIQLITTKADVEELLRLDEYVDVIVPRGGAKFIKYVREHSTVPVIETGAGNNHIFVNWDADFEMANKIIVNAKVQRPAVCNAVRKVLIHEKIAKDYLPKLMEELRKYGVRVKGGKRAREIDPSIEPVSEQDWYEEYMDLTLAVKVIGSVEEAVDHVNKYGTRHSDAIITKNLMDAEYFTWNVDSACTYVNASTRLTDGGIFGFGAEVGISTQKLHARGPMGIRELTTTKYIIYGSGQVREL